MSKYIISKEGIMMEKMWKTILIACFIALISVITSGMTTLADDAEQYEEEAITVLTEMSERDTVGTNEITVGDGVTATFDSETGAIEFYSNGGTLWKDWGWKTGINANSIKSIKIASGTVYLPENSGEIFSLGYYDEDETIPFTNLEELDLSGFDTSYVAIMESMFEGCSSLKYLDVSGFYTSNVTDMDHMFKRCSSLTELDLCNFDTSNVSDMCDMFSECNSLTYLNIGSFNTSNVRDMGWMFFDCYSLKELDLSSFDMSNVRNELNEELLLSNCDGLEVLWTPKMNSIDGITLPHTMYDEQGIAYNSLPVLSKSIVLGSTKEIAEENSTIDVSTCIVTLNQTEYTYDGKAKEPVITVSDGKQVLSAGTDYTVTYLNNRNAGVAVVTIAATDIGNYKGTTTVYFTIDKAEAGLTYAKSSLTKQTTDAAFNNALSKTTDEVATFASSNTKVAEVDSVSGLVTIKGAGTATITAVTSEGKNYKAGSTSYILTVKAPTPTPSPAASGFSDVQDLSHPYYNAIYWAAEAGITKGYSDGTFGVNRSCTRGEMMMFLWRYAGKPSPKAVSKSPFKDVAMNHVFYKAILWGAQKGITKGYSNGTFGINKNVSRGECMMFLWRLKGKPAPKTVSRSPFKDVLTSQAFYKAILWGSQKGVTKGYIAGPKKGNFGVNDNCTRGQIVTFLYRA